MRKICITPRELLYAFLLSELSRSLKTMGQAKEWQEIRNEEWQEILPGDI